MARLLWGESTQRRFETGVDHGVFYPDDGPGIAWNGLVEVSESAIGGDQTPYHLDGIKYTDVVTPRHFQAAVTAYSAPDQFDECVGEHSIVPGFVLTRQARKRFGFSYRTLIGSEGEYKIHLVYNASAVRTGRSAKSRDASNDVPTLSWTVDAVPPESEFYKPTAHFVVDSTKMDPEALSVIESVLYGTGTKDPQMLSADELIGLAGFWSPVTVQENQTTSYALLVPGMGDLYRMITPGILHILPDSTLVPTGLDSGFYRKE